MAQSGRIRCWVASQETCELVWTKWKCPNKNGSDVTKKGHSKSPLPPWYEPMTFLRMQGVYENAPRTPNAYDRWISKRKWEVEFMNWRHRVNEKSTTFAAWKWEWKLAKALKHTAEKCGLGGRVGTQVLAHQHMREWDKTNDKWHEHHRIQQACAKAKPRLHIEHPPRPKAVKFATGRLLLAPRPEFIEKDH